MEAHKLATIDDLLLATSMNERIELINGEIVKRPMARLSDEIAPFKRRKGVDGCGGS
jgi:hypothetical protein